MIRLPKRKSRPRGIASTLSASLKDLWGSRLEMERDDAKNAAIVWLENQFDGWTIKPSDDPDGTGERFELCDHTGATHHTLGLTDELLSEKESGKALWQHLDVHHVRRELLLFGVGQIIWLGTTGWIIGG